MVSIIICDDDIELLKNLHIQISEILEKAAVKAKIHQFQSMDEISDQMLSGCDIAFLDIDYNERDYNGLDIARRLRQFRKDAVIIFVTNFIEYAPEGYEVQAFRYILKRNVKTDLEPYIIQALTHLRASRETIKIQLNGEYVNLLIEDVLYMEVLQHNVTLYVRKAGSSNNVKSYVVYSTLSDMEKQLADPE